MDTLCDKNLAKLRRENRALLELIAALTAGFSLPEKRKLFTRLFPALGGKITRKTLARALGITRSTLYYSPRAPSKDLALKARIEETLRQHPSFGHRRLAKELQINKKRVLRVMHRFGLIKRLVKK